MTSLIIVGAGGFGLEVASYAIDLARSGLEAFEPKGFLDDKKTVGAIHHHLPVLGTTSDEIDQDALYVIALGAPEHRHTLLDKLTARGAKFTSLIHPSAYVATTAQICEGTILAPFSFAGPESHIGPNAVLNIYASVAHESRIGAHAVLSPYAGTHACAILGDEVFLGAHATVTKDVQVGARAKLAAGAVAYNNIPLGATAMGNPARFREAD